MGHRRSTPLEELMFLFLFIVLFATILTTFNRLLLPHNYSKMVVLLLASIVVGVLTVFLRYWMFFRKREKS